MITVHADEIRIAGEAVARLTVPEDTFIAGKFLGVLSGLHDSEEEAQQEIYELSSEITELRKGIDIALAALETDDVRKAVDTLKGLPL